MSKEHEQKYPLLTRRDFLKLATLTAGFTYLEYNFTLPLVKNIVEFSRRKELPLLENLPHQTILTGISPDNNLADDAIETGEAIKKRFQILNYFASSPGWFDSLLPQIDLCLSAGKIPMISWYPKDPEIKSINSYDQMLIYEDQIRQGAQQLKERGVPILFRLLYEMNGTWFGWHIENNPEQAKNFWRAVHKIYKEEEATNVKFVFCPNVMANPIENYFPGEEYVDFTALDIYPNKLLEFLNISQKFLIAPDLVTLHSLAPNTPFMIGEIGAENPDWIFESIVYTITHMPNVAGVLPFNWDTWNMQKNPDKMRMYQRLFNYDWFYQGNGGAQEVLATHLAPKGEIINKNENY